jgi:hypothetical protein
VVEEPAAVAAPVVEEPAAVEVIPEETPAPEEPSSTNLNDLDFDELKALAEERGVEVEGRLSKKKLRKALRQAKGSSA